MFVFLSISGEKQKHNVDKFRTVSFENESSSTRCYSKPPEMTIPECDYYHKVTWSGRYESDCVANIRSVHWP